MTTQKVVAFAMAVSAISFAQTTAVPTERPDSQGSVICSKARQASSSSDLKAVVLQLTINDGGIVKEFHILQPSGTHLEKDEAVNAAVKAIRFSPARKDGSPVPVQIKMSIDCSGAQTGDSDNPKTGSTSK